MRLLLIMALALPFTLRSCWDHPAMITVTAPAKFEKREAGAIIGAKDFCDIYLRFFDGTRCFEVLWGTEIEGRVTSFFPVELTPGQEYAFTFAREKPSVDDSVVNEDIELPHIVRIDKPVNIWNAPALYDREICEVHHCGMQRKSARIVYGMLGTLYTNDELKTLFPHSQEFVAGGCILGDRKTDLIFVCSQCKNAYGDWHKIHARRAYEKD